MRGMVMAGLLAVVVTPLAWGQDWLPPRVMERVNQASRIRLEFGDGLLEMRRPRVEWEGVSGVLRVPREVPLVVNLLMDGIQLRRSVDTLIPGHRIVTMEVKDGTQWLRGGLVGAGVGAAFGVVAPVLLTDLVGQLLGLGYSDAEHVVRPGNLILRVTPITAAVGLSVGMILGALSPKWATIYRRGEILLPAIKWE